MKRQVTESSDVDEIAEVDVRIDGRPASYVWIVPDTAPAVASVPHRFSINESETADTENYYEFSDVTLGIEWLPSMGYEDPDVGPEYLAHTIFIRSKANGTVFTVYSECR